MSGSAAVKEAAKAPKVKGKDGKEWPAPRKILSDSMSRESQQEVLKKWMDEELAAFLKEFGSFKFDEKNNLNEEDFLRIYDLIESVGRFELNQLRDQNEKSRGGMFSKAFVGSGEDKAAYKSYVDKVFTDIEQEIGLYQQVQDQILKKVKINENIWNSSMEVYLPSGEPYIRKAIRFSMSSPYKYEGEKTESKIIEIYKEASDFGLKMLVDSQVFNNVLLDQGELDDEQDKLIILDYLVIDYVKAHHGLSSNSFKSAISAYGLLEQSDLRGQIEKIVQSFVTPAKHH